MERPKGPYHAKFVFQDSCTRPRERESIWYVPVSAPTVRADLTISDGACWLSLGAAVEFISQCQRNEGEDEAQVSLWRQESEELSAQGLAIDTKERSSSVG